MISYLLAGAAEEPVSLVEAKAFLKIDDTAEDGLIRTLIAAARLHVEGVTGRALLAQSWRLVLDNWPVTRMIKLPVTPLMSVTAISAIDPSGASHEVGLEQFQSDRERLLLPRRIAGMPSLQAYQGIEIDYVAGYGSAADEVPADLRQAVLLLIAHWHEHRDAVVMAGSGAVVPSGFDRVVSAYKQVRM